MGHDKGQTPATYVHKTSWMQRAPRSFGLQRLCKLEWSTSEKYFLCTFKVALGHTPFMTCQTSLAQLWMVTMCGPFASVISNVSNGETHPRHMMHQFVLCFSLQGDRRLQICTCTCVEVCKVLKPISLWIPSRASVNASCSIWIPHRRKKRFHENGARAVLRKSLLRNNDAHKTSRGTSETLGKTLQFYTQIIGEQKKGFGGVKACSTVESLDSRFGTLWWGEIQAGL